MASGVVPEAAPSNDPSRITPHSTSHARRLYLSVATVKAHVSSVLVKLGVENRTQVALLVHEAGAD